MILPYALRLVCLSFACFFLAHTALGLLAWCLAPVVVRKVERLRPRLATHLLLALRLSPAALAGLAVLGLCIPSYLVLEPASSGERIGFTCLAAALLGAAACAVSLTRAVRAGIASVGFARRFRRGLVTSLPGDPPVLVLDDDFPLLAVTGVFRPRLIISRGILRSLSPDQLDVALQHECAHRASRDNFKRLLLLLAPGWLPFSHGSAAIERAWARLSEWAADDQAIAGDAQRSVALAEALIRVSRMGAAPRISPLFNSLVSEDRDFSARVERLLDSLPPPERRTLKARDLFGGAAILAAGLLAFALTCPGTLSAVHGLLERLVR